MSDTFHETIGGSEKPAVARQTSVIRESFDEGGSHRPSRDAAASGKDVMTELKVGGLRNLPEKWAEALADKPKAAPVDAAPVETSSQEPAGGPGQATGAPSAEPAAPAPSPVSDTAALTRLEAANRQLLADLEAARATPQTGKTKLHEASDVYVDDSVSAVRRFVAHTLGVEDPDSQEVTDELSALTLDLTAKLFGASLDQTQQASRQAAKARQALAQDKRSRKAESDAATKSEQVKAETLKAEQVATFIGNRMSLAREGGKSLRDKHPVAAALSPLLHGKSIEALVYDTFQQELKTGRLDPARAGDDDYLIGASLEIIESNYQDLIAKIDQARPKSSTASTSNTQSASQAPPQGHGGRTLTAADGSAAPATLPSATQVSKSEPKRPRTRAELLDKYFPD